MSGRILETLESIEGLLGGSSGGGATADGQNTANDYLDSIDSKLAGTLSVTVVNQIDLTTVTNHLLAIKNSCAAIDANTDTVEQKLLDIIAAINANGTVNHDDLLTVITQLQAVNANTDGQEALLTSILNKLIAAPATLAEQQTQSTTLSNVNTKIPDQIASRLPVSIRDYGVDVSRGNISGESVVVLKGFNQSISTTNEPIWAQSGITYPLPTTAQTLTISSSSANDTLAGTGAQIVQVKYVRYSDLAEVTATFNMNGQTPVTISADGYAVNEVRVGQVGTALGNVGTIYVGYGTVTTGQPASILSTVVVGSNASQQAIYTVPASKILDLLSFRFSPSVLSFIQFKLRPSKLSGFVSTEYDIPLSSNIAFNSIAPSIIPAGYQVQFWGRANGGGGALGCIIQAYLRSV